MADCEAEPLREWLDEMQYVEHPSRAQLDSLWYVKEQSDILERRTMLLLGRLMEVEEMCKALYGRSPL